MGCLIFGIVLILVMAVLLTIGLFVATPSQTVPSTGPVVAPASLSDIFPSEGSAAASGRSPVAVSGSGASASETLRLVGDYAVTWTAQASRDAGCFISATLERTDGEYTGLRLARDTYDSTALHTGSSNLYGMGGAQYYVDETGGCKWSFTFTPR